MPTQTILAVDDSPTELGLAKACLEKKGYKVLTATDGEEAIAIANRELPPVIVLDIIMPKKNGYQVLRELKTNEKTKGIKVVLLSSKNQDSDRHWGLKQGADEYVTKPFDDATLLTAVGKMF